MDGLVQSVLGSRRGPPPPTEQELWAYATGVLAPEERDRMIKRLAESEEAQEELRQIRSALVEARAAPPVLARARAAFQKALAPLKQEMPALAVAIVRVGRELLTVFRAPTWEELTPEPALLGVEAAAPPTEARPARAKPRPRRVPLRNADGLCLAVAAQPEGGTSVFVELPDKAAEGLVELALLIVAPDGLRPEPPACRAQMRAGRALLTDCPDGFLRLTGPKGLCVEFFLGAALGDA